MNDKNIKMGVHISKQFDMELENIREDVLKMGGLVEAQLGRVLVALMDGDSDTAALVAAEDYKINQFEMDIDEEAVGILARRSPTATDLRLVVAVTKVVRDLERIGDETERMAKMIQHSIEIESPENYYKGFITAGESIRQLLQNTLNTFARMDVHKAVQMMREGYNIDKQFSSMTKQLVDRMKKNPETIASALDMMWAIRCLEKIGDHCINILENVVYSVKGQDIRHQHVDEVAESIK